MLASEAGAHHDRVAIINLHMRVAYGGTEVVTLHAGAFGAMAKANNSGHAIPPWNDMSHSTASR